MLEYTREELTEKDLENKIIKHPSLIEDGLQYLEHQRHTSSGRLDILFVDNNGTITVAELKVVEDPHVLFQALDYFDFVAEKIEGFNRIYKKHGINVEQYPRLMLIAPSFSPIMINRCRWLNPDIQISLYVYQYITFPKTKEDTLVFIPQEISVRPTVLKKAPDINKLLGYIKNKNVRDYAKQILDKTQALSSDVTIDALQWGKSVKYKGSVLYYWEPRKACIRISITNEDGNWEGVNVEKEDDYIEAMNLIKKNIGKYE
ncbi:MAG: endonuclease NucS domain-containing protein [Candidatus Scalinduaceae bacterium]